MELSDELVQRRKAVHRSATKPENLCNGNECHSLTQGGLQEEPKLTLMDEVLLLGMKDKEGHTSFWNDALSLGLRASIFVELSFRNRLALESSLGRRRRLVSRKVIVANDEPTGEHLLDETLKLVKSLIPAENVQDWIDYLTGESWNPFKFKYQLRNVRERLAKNLVEKGVLTTDKKSYVFFNITTHPIIDTSVKESIIRKIQDFLLTKWTNDVQRMDKRVLCLILLAYASDVFENAITDLNDEQYDLASNRIDELKNIDFEMQAAVSNSDEVMWAICYLLCH